MGPPESGTIEGLVDSSAGGPSPLIDMSGGLGKIGEAMFNDTVTVK